ADGVNWVQRQSGQSSENRWLNAIAYGNGQFVAVGAGVIADDPNHPTINNILTSADGVKWVDRQSGTSAWLWDVAYGNGQFVAVGDPDLRAILTSADGVKWVVSQSWTEMLTCNDYVIRLFVCYDCLA